ncbi:hypothetical protein GJ744_004494 [Endocarpon pusillum]|uniref:Uncharacterized protein n=1 Tax=Endocarpon pusillum TaxID=364733 RepID=A0A8H7ATN8_9EURO|nr:hypothetical protein GJ744_004494 [Endocarpon pusillum]
MATNWSANPPSSAPEIVPAAPGEAPGEVLEEEEEEKPFIPSPSAAPAMTEVSRA